MLHFCRHVEVKCHYIAVLCHTYPCRPISIYLFFNSFMLFSVRCCLKIVNSPQVWEIFTKCEASRRKVDAYTVYFINSIFLYLRT